MQYLDPITHLRAVLPAEHAENGRNYGDKKELISAYSLVGLHPTNGFGDYVTVRCYMGRSSSASTVYASIWVHTPDHCTAGHGSAGGYGYHKESAATDEAIRSAGIKLYGTPYTHREASEVDMEKLCNIHGVGSTGIDNALVAIGQALGLSDMFIVKH